MSWTPSNVACGAVGRSTKVLISAYGLRGDVQPFFALAAGLQSAGGYTVKVATNKNWVPFCSSLGVTGEPVFFDLDEANRTAWGQECQSNGHMNIYQKKLGEHAEADFPDMLKRKLQLIEEFDPDILITSDKCHYEDAAIGATKRIPVLPATLFASFPSTTRASKWGEPDWFPGRWKLACHILSLQGEWSNHKMKKDAAIKNSSLKDKDGSKDQHLLPSQHRVLQRYLSHPPAQTIVGASERLFPRCQDWHDDLTPKICGAWICSEALQTGGIAMGGSAMFGSTRVIQGTLSDMDIIAAFIKEDPSKPLACIGWGSMVMKPPIRGSNQMTGPEYMTCLAVRALKKADMRGIIVSQTGWAHMSADLITADICPSDCRELKVYAKRNIRFVEAAPHEWLFPQCTCTVHHGGAGTTYSALRSGVPTIITPVLGDQFVFERVVKEKGVGLGLGKLNNLTVDDLAAALETCNRDERLKKNAKDLSKVLQTEDGVTEAVKHVSNWWQSEIKTDQAYDRNQQAWQRDRAVLESRCSFGCFGWIHRICCSPHPHNYRVS